ncbi:hypothetical protein JAAARDRAFT_206931 [Jaapia argillacea MUCL 33604]|uniref:BTB domain-containing protein n=1 Tax=Jaapia argillacea MUCL 33604 TaxID=933084 RepID=A0A067PWN9_9AGAM|nr:hypothetical protein JAAARDRAFT_206931 [Jaapia argillacea MUCL 33604]
MNDSPEVTGSNLYTPYFEDGNIVISSFSQDGSPKFFRVHRSVLSVHSGVFAQIFSIPVPSEAAGMDMHDGVPLVHLPDPAEDIGGLLRATYDLSSLPNHHRDPNKPILMKGILALATKYEFEITRSHIIQSIERDWPHDLQGWDALENEVSQVAPRGFPHIAAPPNYPEPASALRLARTFGITSILSATFYDLSRISAIMDWDICRKSDTGGLWKRLCHRERSARWSALDASDFICVLRGRERLQIMHRDIVSSVLDVPVFMQRCTDATNPVSRDAG